MNTNQSKFLTFKEATIYLGISKSTLYKLTASKQIRFYKPKGKLFFKEEDLLSFMTHKGAMGIEISSNL
ncbi:helix-turn-helix domain-containing protein [Flavobacterium sp. J49]|uniref:helix-turn-helix domain-containing protein n=1 Tax=Flavobacterium sp. J49 TaxID=2718534 RepID=UPI00159324ED|nr:helix-turn-helix domain-containing protein [Flavobacterium sp. J49]MBF6641666.1 helix-turn-helix domain-containing protein [Flavobacterium sp. J49]NIC02913.1 helix-turn-helix domain-containing protein [Flavobacterium sp. J49]